MKMISELELTQRNGMEFAGDMHFLMRAMWIAVIPRNAMFLYFYFLVICTGRSYGKQ